MYSSLRAFALILSFASFLSGCANNTPATNTPDRYSNSGYGVVESIEVVPVENEGIAGTGVGAGAVIGGVVGGVLGHQVGGGRGKDAATAAGVVGGAVVGHQIEKSRNQNEAYRIGIRLENGGYQTFTQKAAPDLRVGDRVRIDNGALYRY